MCKSERERERGLLLWGIGWEINGVIQNYRGGIERKKFGLEVIQSSITMLMEFVFQKLHTKHTYARLIFKYK